MGDVTPTRAGFWLQDRARQDPDVKMLVHAAYRKYQVSNMSELVVAHEDVVMALYEGAVDMLEGVDDMQSYDGRVRDSWMRQRADGT